jgi:hypothetical protein
VAVMVRGSTREASAWPSQRRERTNRVAHVSVQPIMGAEKLCSNVRVGDYLFGEGDKEHEALFMAWDISAERR